MTILAVVRDVCVQVGVPLPTSIFAGITANRTMQEMLALANEMAQRISYDTRDWRELTYYHEVLGDGVKEDFDLPNNFKRLTMTASVWRKSTPDNALRFIPDADEWLSRRLRNEQDSGGEWIILNGQISIVPKMVTGDAARFSCVDKNCIRLASGGFSETFIADGDQFRLDERVLKLGMIWQWKASKGSPYAEDMGTYSDALVNAMGHDSPSPVIVGKTKHIERVRHAYNWR